jgi:hypothetical protein
MRAFAAPSQLPKGVQGLDGSNRKVLSMKSKTFSSGSLSGFLAKNFQIIIMYNNKTSWTSSDSLHSISFAGSLRERVRFASAVYRKIVPELFHLKRACSWLDV